MHTPRYVRTFLGPDSSRTALLFVIGSLSVIVGGIVHAAAFGWLSDDIFITFRYIDQWFAGNGLVYNPGEYVEGYTHPLWMLLLSAWRLIGFDMISGSVLFGVVAQGLLLMTLVYASWRLAGRALLAIPASAAAVAVHHDASMWATSGLETGLFTFLVTLSVVLMSTSTLGDRTRLIATGTTLVLATLTRPDGVLFLVTMGVVVLFREWSRGSAWRTVRARAMQYALPALVFVPYALWKLSYYGDLLPNTYYAKSGGGTHFAQGFTYIWLFVQGYPSLILSMAGIAALAVVYRRPGIIRERISAVFADPLRSTSFVCLLMAGVYVLFFVARVGGDFMYARFLVPVVPMFYLSAEAGFRAVLARRQRALVIAVLSIPLLAGTVDSWSRHQLFTVTEDGDRVLADGTTGIIDEHHFWTKPFTDDGHNAIEMLRGIGDSLRTYFDGLTVRILIRGQASLAYESKATEVVENWGLTDPYIAHLEISGRGRVGHEKAAPMEYIVSRRVHFFFFDAFTPSDTSFYRIVRFDLPYGWHAAEMHFYDRDLMRELKRRFPEQVHFVDFEQYLDQYLATSATRTRQEMQDAFLRAKAYYFNHNFDPVRERRFLEALRAKSGRRGLE